jgi:hypothetical protein
MGCAFTRAGRASGEVLAFRGRGLVVGESREAFS